MDGRNTRLVDFGLPPEPLEGETTTAQKWDPGAPTLRRNNRGSGTATFVSNAGKTVRRRNFEIAPVSCVFNGDIPNVVLAIRRRQAKTSVNRAIVAKCICRITVAIRASAGAAQAVRDVAPEKIACQICGIPSPAGSHEHSKANK